MTGPTCSAPLLDEGDVGMTRELRLAAAEVASAQLALRADDSATVTVVWANAAMLKLLRCAEDELVGTSIESHTKRSAAPSAEDSRLPDWWSVVRGALRGDRPLSDAAAPHWHSARVWCADQSETMVAVQVTAVDSAGWVVSLRPVDDEIRRAEEAGREAEHRFAALAQHAPVGILLSEAGIRLGYVNSKICEIAGASPAELLGTRWLEVIHPDDLADLLSSLDQLMAGEPVKSTVRIGSRIGPPRWVEFRLTPITTPQHAAGFLGTVEDITDRHAHDLRLTYLASHDALTGLVNRRGLLSSLDALLHSRRGSDHNIAVLFGDLDGFKEVNDTFGHDGGDRVLVEVASRLSSAARENDLVARIAGDEFVIIAHGITERVDAEAAVRRHLAALVQPIQVDGTVARIGLSFGVAMGTDYNDASVLLQAADQAMYEAKRAGRGIFRIAPMLCDQDQSIDPGVIR